MMLLKGWHLDMIYPDKKNDERGFSLVEMAIVLVILGALLGGILMPLASQRDINNRRATETQLNEIRNALIGFAQLYSRLPCPTDIDSDGIELGPPGDCTVDNGFVPYATLGIQGNVNLDNEQLVDTWQMPIRYRLSNVNSWEYAKNIYLDSPPPDFQICSDDACALNNIIAQRVVAVIFSTGKNFADNPAPTSPDEALNINGVANFVSRTPTETLAGGEEFDDILVWIPHPLLIYELSKAGQLVPRP